MALMGDGEVMLGTNNRNFLGRFGSPRAKAYLVNPEVAAASAIAGEIASARGWTAHFRGGVSLGCVASPCFLRCALISHYFFPRRRSPVIMDRDSITGG